LVKRSRRSKLVSRAFPLAAAFALLLGTCAAAAPPGLPTQSKIRLPGTWPKELALAGDGSIWATGEYGGVARLDSTGHVKKFDVGQDEYAADLVAGPDGAIWIAANDLIVRIDAAGRRRSWHTGGDGLAQAITSFGGALWFANPGNPGRIERLGTDGSIRSFKIAGPRKGGLMPGIAGGADGALWFTQTGSDRDPPDGIGRMTTDGRSASWELPHRRGIPIRIAAGTDGALWFTELDGHAIGRITASGAIGEFPLATGLSPYDIKAGVDGAMWFTADGCIGRITTDGKVTAWPIQGAGRLIGIAPRPDGSIWAADDLKSVLWRFVPPADAAPPPKPCAPPTITRRARSTRARLVYRRELTLGHSEWFSDPRVRISRGGKQLFAETVPPIDRRYGSGVYGDASSFAVRDLDGDGEPEVMVQLNWNGAHCCTWSRIYRYVPSLRTYVPGVHFWGDDGASPRILDLNGDGKPEFSSRDDRFAYVFEAYAFSAFPIRIWSYRHGRFRNVTRRYPAAIGRDAARLWRLYVHVRRKKDETVRGLLPAWAADEYLLGRRAVVWSALEQAARQGYLSCPRNGCLVEPRDPQAYIKRVRAFLRKTGYLH
jgi:streptogramin lyase